MNELSNCCNAEMTDLANCKKCGKFGFLDVPSSGKTTIKPGESKMFEGESITLEQDGEDLIVTPEINPLLSQPE